MENSNYFNSLPQAAMPVITIPDEQSVKPMIDALIAGGCKVLEITLRTPAGLLAIEYASQQYPDIAVGAGSVVTADDWRAAVKAGAAFLVSPGASEGLYNEYKANPIPWLPGVANASDIIRAIENGLSQVKFFPASVLGGLPALKSYASVFPKIQFCPTGGVKPDAAKDWLSEKMIFAVGGSWFTPAQLVDARDWQGLSDHVKSFWESNKDL